MIGLTGLVCDTRRSSKLREAIRKGALPLDRLMLETDAPFCTPKCIPNAPRRCGKTLRPKRGSLLITHLRARQRSRWLRMWRRMWPI